MVPDSVLSWAILTIAVLGFSIWLGLKVISELETYRSEEDAFWKERR